MAEQTTLTIGHASSDYDGVSGDSEGKEVCRRTWYDGGASKWHTLLRPKRELLAQQSAIAVEQACDNNKVGYSQNTRNSLWTQTQLSNYVIANIVTACNCDCSSLMHVAAMVGGCANLTYSGNAVTTSTIVSTFVGTGEYDKFTDSKYLTSDTYLQRGDILVKNGHIVMILLNGSECDPDYAMDGATDDSSLDNVLEMMGSLYDVEVEKGDALLREVGYIDSKIEPSIKSSNITLTVINYTNLLGNLFSMYVPQGVSDMNADSSVNVDNVSDTSAKTIIRYLVDEKKISGAAACGVTANIYHESTYRTNALGDYKDGVPTSFGICQWHNERGQAMKEFVGDDWETDLSGQLDYLWKELTENSAAPGCLAGLQAVTNTLEGAKKAADIFVRKFERPAEVDEQSLKRQQTAESLWGQLVIQQV